MNTSGSDYTVTPDSFICPISQAIMKDPYIDSEGNSYDWETIQEWLQLNPFSPFTRNPLNITNLVPNRALKVVIDEFVRFGFKVRSTQEIYVSLNAFLEREG